MANNKDIKKDKPKKEKKKRKPVYEIQGFEMCIRDSCRQVCSINKHFL